MTNTVKGRVSWRKPGAGSPRHSLKLTHGGSGWHGKDDHEILYTEANMEVDNPVLAKENRTPAGLSSTSMIGGTLRTASCCCHPNHDEHPFLVLGLLNGRRSFYFGTTAQAFGKRWPQTCARHLFSMYYMYRSLPSGQLIDWAGANVVATFAHAAAAPLRAPRKCKKL